MSSVGSPIYLYMSGTKGVQSTFRCLVLSINLQFLPKYWQGFRLIVDDDPGGGVQKAWKSWGTSRNANLHFADWVTLADRLFSLLWYYVQYLHKALKKLAGDKELVSNQLISGRWESQPNATIGFISFPENSHSNLCCVAVVFFAVRATKLG